MIKKCIFSFFLLRFLEHLNNYRDNHDIKFSYRLLALTYPETEATVIIVEEQLTVFWIVAILLTN